MTIGVPRISSPAMPAEHDSDRPGASSPGMVELPLSPDIGSQAGFCSQRQLVNQLPNKYRKVVACP